MLVAAAGAVDHQQIVAEAEKRFASFVGPAGPQPEQAHFSGGMRVETRDLEQWALRITHYADELERFHVQARDRAASRR